MSPKQGTDNPTGATSLQEWASHTKGAGVGGEQLLWPICVIAKWRMGKCGPVRGKCEDLGERRLRQT